MARGAEATMQIEAPPAVLYDLLADVTRMGEYSPECQRCVWLDGAAGPAVGARFKGWNRWRFARWARVCEVLAADPGREFAFRTLPLFPFADSTTWRYTFTPADAGTWVVETYEVTRLPWWMSLAERLVGGPLGRPEAVAEAMRQTLLRLRAAAEVQPPAG
jgi:hypothetical protein